jgi:hypothetical protein
MVQKIISEPYDASSHGSEFLLQSLRRAANCPSSSTLSSFVSEQSFISSIWELNATKSAQLRVKEIISYFHLHLTESQQNRGERYDFTTSFTRSTTDYQCITGEWRQVSFTSTQLYINHLKVNETYFPLMNAVNLFQDKTKNIGAESSFRPNR